MQSAPPHDAVPTGRLWPSQGISNVHLALNIQYDYIEGMASGPLTRDVAVTRLAQAEAA